MNGPIRSNVGKCDCETPPQPSNPSTPYPAPDHGSFNIRHRGIQSVPIPYYFVYGAVAFSGIIYLNEPLEDSYVDGVFAGSVVVGSYHLSKSDYEACANNGVIRVCINFDPDVRRKLYALFCTRNFSGGWDCGDWMEIASW